jgi:hypothetical protein
MNNFIKKIVWYRPKCKIPKKNLPRYLINEKQFGNKIYDMKVRSKKKIRRPRRET